MDIRFRVLWTLIAAAEEGSTSRAACALNLTQPAISRAIKLAEKQLGVTLFKRHATGIVPTESGEIVIRRARRVRQHLRAADVEIGNLAGEAVDRDNPAGFHGKLTRQQLTALISVAAQGNVPYAARETGYSTAVIWRALRELRALVGENLVEHRGSGISPSVCGEILIRQAKLAFAEIRHISDDLESARGRISGRVVIGALPLSRTILLPRAVAQLARRHPHVELSIVDGPYKVLLAALRCGDIDFIVGALRSPPPAKDVSEEALFSEPLSMAARVGHPLTRRPTMSISDLAGRDWVVPIRGTPTRRIFEALFEDAGIDPPKRVIESSSLASVRALLLESDYLTFISRSQLHYDEQFGILTALQVEGLAGTRRPIGISTRTDAGHSSAVHELINQLHAVSCELYGQEAAVPARAAVR